MVKKTKRSIEWIKQKPEKYAGIHLLAEFWQTKNINNSKKIEQILIGAAKAAKATPLKISIYKFKPQGLTGVILLSESHISLHTWPEINYIAIDIFTCGKKNPKKALDYLKKVFNPKRVEIKEIKRGRIKYGLFKKSI